VKRPAKELRGFQRVGLNPKEKKSVTFTLPASDLAFYDEKAKKFVVEPGAFDVMIGSSSADIRLKARLKVSGLRACHETTVPAIGLVISRQTSGSRSGFPTRGANCSQLRCVSVKRFTYLRSKRP